MRDWPEEDHGPNTPIREYSLLQNPRTPAFVKIDKLDIRICKVRTPRFGLYFVASNARSSSHAYARSTSAHTAAACGPKNLPIDRFMSAPRIELGSPVPQTGVLTTKLCRHSYTQLILVRPVLLTVHKSMELVLSAEMGDRLHG